MRIGKIELMRFLGAVLIMNAHFGYQDRPFQLSWFFVEFFYIITGYFSMRHFEKQEPQEHFEAVKIAVEYTGKKFVQFLPYTTGAILITYIAMNWHYIGEGAFGNFIRSFENMPFEMLYLSEAAPEGSLLFTMWFLSAMCLVFPFFCLLLMMRNRRLSGMICFYVALFYYLHTFDYGAHEFPNRLVRTFAGLCLGATIALLADWLRGISLNRTCRVWLSVLEVITYVFPIVTCYPHFKFLRGNLLCFVVSVTIIFSGQSMVPDMSCRFFSWLGRLSMPLYVWHIAVLRVIERFFPDVDMLTKVLGFWLGTFALAIGNMYLVGFVKHRLRKDKECTMN